jgi:ferredoxin
MRKTRIYFFSGAGHSFAVSRELATYLASAELVNISTLLKRDTVDDTTEQIGFVFPVYGGMPPKFIREWLAHFRPGKSSMVFAVCTCGIAPGHSLIEVDRILRSSGSRLTLGFAVRQPQAGIGSKRINTPELVEGCRTKQKEKIKEVARHIQKGELLNLERSGRFSEFLNTTTITVLPTLVKLIFHLITKGIKNMKFRPGTGCNGCGICVRLCPADNIRMVEAYPQWGDNCLGCMGCYHWCPEDAVKNVDLDMIQSPHRDVTVGEMLKYTGKQKIDQ